MAVSFDRARLAPLKDAVAVVGVGETDYGKDYRGAGGQAVSKGEVRYDSRTRWRRGHSSVRWTTRD